MATPPENESDPIQLDVNNILEEVIEIETHLHSYERWRGLHGTPTGTRFADETETSWQIDSGNTVFGSWVQVLGTDDTPVDTGKTYFDWHRILITAVERTVTYRVQFAFGAAGDAAVAAGDYTEVCIQVGVGALDPFPVTVQGLRHVAGTEAWARCRCNANTGTMDFMVGIHEYDS